MERAYRRGRPLTPNTEMMVQEMGSDSDARRLGNYVVVRRVVRPRVRVDQTEEGGGGTEDAEDGKWRNIGISIGVGRRDGHCSSLDFKFNVFMNFH